MSPELEVGQYVILAQWHFTAHLESIRVGKNHDLKKSKKIRFF